MQLWYQTISSVSKRYTRIAVIMIISKIYDRNKSGFGFAWDAADRAGRLYLLRL